MKESIVYNMDCLEYMKTLPDKAFDLAIVDPPYGGGGMMANSAEDTAADSEACSTSTISAQKISTSRGGAGSQDTKSQESPSRREVSRTGGTWAAKYGTTIRHWDYAPSREYFEELFRVSKNQIIWGGNYFNLPPTRCFVVWRKVNIPVEGFTLSPVEYAWTNYNRNAMCYEFTSSGTPGNPRIHPCQKPVQLYKYLLSQFAKDGYRILDTHVGSGSSRIACAEYGFDFVGCEIDKTYFDLQEKRYEEWTSQLRFDF